MSETDRQAEIRRFYARYLAAFHTGNAAAVAPFYRAPCLFIADQGVTLLETDAEIEHLFGQVIAGLRARHYARSEVRDVQIKELSDRLALFSGLAVRYTTTGEELERLSATYTLRKSDDVWKIVTVVAHGPDTLVRFGDEPARWDSHGRTMGVSGGKMRQVCHALALATGCG